VKKASTLVKCTAEEIEVCWPVFFEVNGKNIEAHEYILLLQLTQVVPSQTLQRLLFVLIYRCFRSRHGAGGACLHLDNAKRIALPRDQIKVAWSPSRSPSACYDDEAEPAEIEKCGALSFPADGQVGSFGLPPNCGAIADIEEGFEEAQPG